MGKTESKNKPSTETQRPLPATAIINWEEWKSNDNGRHTKKQANPSKAIALGIAAVLCITPVARILTHSIDSSLLSNISIETQEGPSSPENQENKLQEQTPKSTEKEDATSQDLIKDSNINQTTHVSEEEDQEKPFIVDDLASVEPAPVIPNAEEKADVPNSINTYEGYQKPINKEKSDGSSRINEVMNNKTTIEKDLQNSPEELVEEVIVEELVIIDSVDISTPTDNPTNFENIDYE